MILQGILLGLLLLVCGALLMGYGYWLYCSLLDKWMGHQPSFRDWLSDVLPVWERRQRKR